jgi:hypothetical protein
MSRLGAATESGQRAAGHAAVAGLHVAVATADGAGILTDQGPPAGSYCSYVGSAVVAEPPTRGAPVTLPVAHESQTSGLIPSPIDQNRWAHWRNPMDMIRQG